MWGATSIVFLNTETLSPVDPFPVKQTDVRTCRRRLAAFEFSFLLKRIFALCDLAAERSKADQVICIQFADLGVQVGTHPYI